MDLLLVKIHLTFSLSGRINPFQSVHHYQRCDWVFSQSHPFNLNSFFRLFYPVWWIVTLALRDRVTYDRFMTHSILTFVPMIHSVCGWVRVWDNNTAEATTTNTCKLPVFIELIQFKVKWVQVVLLLCCSVWMWKVVCQWLTRLWVYRVFVIVVVVVVCLLSVFERM